MSEDPRRHVVTESQHASTLAAIVRELLDGVPWSKARELVRSGRVEVGGALCFDPASRVDAGAVVEVSPTGRRRKAPTLERDRVVHVDRDLVVVRKPPGLLTVPYDDADTRDTLIERTRLALEGMDHERSAGRPKAERLGVVQRLDKDTTGLLVFARTRAGRKGLEAQFRAHTIERRYVALVHGRAEATIHDTHLVADRGDGLRGSWRGRKAPKTAKRAITKVRVEERLRGALGEFTLISCRIETGRQHQIRIHLSEAGNPLVGEQVYVRKAARQASTGASSGGPIAPRPMLHAASLGFRHPVNDRPMRFEAPLPDDFRAIIEALGVGGEPGPG